MTVLLALFISFGCVYVTESAAAEPATSERTIEYLGDRYTVVTVRLGADTDIRLYGGRSGGFTFADAIAAAKREGRRTVALTNGGMYAPDYGPVGLFIANGEERHAINLRDGEGNFHLKPNGVFWMDSTGFAHVTVSETFPKDRSHVTFATQSGPMLLIDGVVHSALKPESTNRLRRSGVGVSADGKIVNLVISAGDVRFHDLATLFRDTLACDDALFLDGVVSNMWSNGEVPSSRYGAVIAVTRQSAN